MRSTLLVYEFEVRRVLRRWLFWFAALLLPLGVSGVAALSLKRFESAGTSLEIGSALVPAIPLAVFYMVIITMSTHMITCTVEEKEGRVSEVLLTRTTSTSLIWGKVGALLTLAVIQVALFAVAVVFLYLLLHDRMQSATLTAADIEIEPGRIGTAILLLAASLLFYTALMVGIGVIMPTVKDASPYVAVVIFVVIAPLLFTTSILQNSNSTAVEILTWLPPTSPVIAMLRTAAGSLPLGAAAASAVVLAAVGLLLLGGASRLFGRSIVGYARIILPFSKS